MFVAASCDNPEIITTAAKLGADLNLRSDLGESALDVSSIHTSARARARTHTHTHARARAV